MQVSAISLCENVSYNKRSSIPFYYSKSNEADTSFNSLTPYLTERPEMNDKTTLLYENINKWQNFCQDRILGKKLDIIV